MKKIDKQKYTDIIEEFYDKINDIQYDIDEKEKLEKKMKKEREEMMIKLKVN